MYRTTLSLLMLGICNGTSTPKPSTDQRRSVGAEIHLDRTQAPDLRAAMVLAYLTRRFDITHERPVLVVVDSGLAAAVSGPVHDSLLGPTGAVESLVRVSECDIMQCGRTSTGFRPVVFLHSLVVDGNRSRLLASMKNGPTQGDEEEVTFTISGEAPSVSEITFRLPMTPFNSIIGKKGGS